MSTSEFVVIGHVFDSGSGASLSGIRVVVHGLASTPADVILVAQTDADGTFCIEIPTEVAKQFLREARDGSRAPKATQLLFFNGAEKIDTKTVELTLGDLVKGAFPSPFRVCFGGQQSLEFVVSGRVVDPQGRGVGRAVVELGAVELLSFHPLGHATTTEDGEYVIHHQGTESSVASDPKLDARLRVQDERGVRIAESAIVFGLRPSHTVNVVAATSPEPFEGLTELERLRRATSKTLAATELHTLDADGIELLAERADVFPLHLALLVQASRLACETEIGADVHYGLMRAGLPADLPGLVLAEPSLIEEALRYAFAERIVPAPGDQSTVVLSTVCKLTAMRIDAAMLSGTSEAPSLGDVLSLSGLEEEKLRVFVEAWEAHDGTRAEFFATLANNSRLDPADAPTLEFTTKVAALTNNFSPAISSLLELRRDGSLDSVEDVAGWDVEAWTRLLQPLGAPPSVPGETEEERVHQYARTMTRIVEAQYPTRVLSRRLEADALPTTEGVSAFLEANPRFEIDRSIIATYATANGVAIDPETETNLKRVQRVYAVTPPLHRYAVTRALLQQEVGSAAEIVRMGRASFIERTAAALDDVDPRHSGRVVATEVFERAALRNGVAVALLAQYAAPMNAVHVDATAMTRLQWTGPAAATLENLFGNQDFCACEHCKSQFGAAAYLVDLLSQLEAAPAVQLPNALAVLRTRRPDLTQVELSCINTNTVMPYIDLVTELLEQLVDGVSPLQANQTSWTAEELRVQPEHVRDTAYAGAGSPADAVFPWSLPFHLPTTETRAYMKILGTPRLEAMRVLARNVASPATVLDAPEHADRVAEAFGMTRQELQIVSGGSAYEASLVPPATVAEAWNVAQPAQIPTEARAVLETTGLRYEELTELLTIDFISPPQSPVVLRYEDDVPTCDLDDISVLGLNASAASRVHRFVRLSRKTSLSPAELSFAIATVGGGSLNYAFVRELAALLQVMSALNLDLDEAAALFSDIPTRSIAEVPSLYDRLFADRRIDGELNPRFALSETASAPGDTVGIAPPTLRSEREALRGALRISDAEFDLLLAELGVVGLNLANLSTLHRHTRLARGLGLSVEAGLRLWRLVELDPFANATETLAYVKVAHQIVDAPMSVAQIDYICRHQFADGAAFSLTDEAAVELIAEIVESVAAIDELLDVAGAADAVASSHLAGLPVEASDVGRIMAVLRIPGALSPAQQGELTALLEGAVLAPASAVADVSAVAGPLGDANLQARSAALNGHFAPFRRSLELDALLSKRLGDFGDIAPPAALALVSSYANHEGDSLRSALVGDVAAARMPALVRFHKAALLVRSLSISTEDLGWYFGAPLGPQSFALDAMPLSPQPDSGGLFLQWRALALGQDLQQQLSWPSNPLAAARDAGSVAAASNILAEAAAWDPNDVRWAVLESFLGMSQADFADPFRVARIRDVAGLVRRSGVHAEQLAVWCYDRPTADQARLLKRAVRSRYSEGQWAAAVTPVSDQIREAKRDALVELLVGRGSFGDAQALYDRLLVDPQMNACMLTSRIKLAISACQLFVQRGLLGLESSAVRFSEEYGRLWWRAKNYRVWEALRRVFFYPENWIEPDLRLDKTPFFDAFESDLDQGDLGEETVERAFQNYLYRLDEVARLEIASIYQEPPDGTDDSEAFWPTGTVHVIGRTRDDPRKYFYRKRIADLKWLPWQPIDLEIRGDNIAVVQFNRRTFIFWAELEPIPYNEDDDDLSKDLGRTYRCRLNWSESREAGWTPIKSVAPTSAEFTPSRRVVTLAITAKAASLEVVVMRYSTTTEPLPLHMKVMWGFRYDWCLDSLTPAQLPSPGNDLIERERIGLPLSRWMLSQRQQSQSGASLDMVSGWREPGEGVLPSDRVPIGRTVLRNIQRPFEVTQSYQRPVYEGLTPAVFDDGKHALYMVPYRVEGPPPEGIVGWDEFGLGTAPPAVPPEEPEPRSRVPRDEVVLDEPWNGSTPGLSNAAVRVSPPAASILASASRVAEAPATLVPTLSAATTMNSLGVERKWRLDNFNHPYTCALIKALRVGGVDAVLGGAGNLRRQRRSHRYLAPDPAGSQYDATDAALLWTDPKNEFDFRYGSAYGQYNWELFFHVPLLIAERYRREQRFEDAARWFHYIFNPLQGQTSGDPSTAARFWKVKPLFAEATEGPDDLIKAIFTGGELDVGSAMVQSFVASVWAWLFDPLDPHGIASVRSGTYRWVVVRKYLDNLIDWGDSLFRRDTIESINEATQLYLLASEILGRKPERLAAAQTEDRTYEELDATALFGGLVELESFNPGPLPPSLTPTLVNPTSPGDDADGPDDYVATPPPPPPAPMWWYFCLPPNDKLLAYWDTVADRLFKIRNCQNIDGLTRQLALFSPPIDPALLVRARAAGVSIDSVLSDLHGPTPIHRFRMLVARATEMCADVRALGAALLSALEKRDSEALAQLRAQHEVAAFGRVKEVRKAQVDEAAAQLKLLAAQSNTIRERRDFYEDRERISTKESRHRKALWVAMGLDIGGAAAKAVAALIKLISAKRELISEGLIGLAETLPIGANIARTVGQQAVTQAGYERREEDWEHASAQADSELKQIEAQAAAADIRIALAERELLNAESQIAEFKAVYEFMRSKYTGPQLYNWMVGQLSGVYFQSYKLAYDLAKQAERAMQRELHVDDTFVAFDAWDNLKKGLLAGERLQLDLRRMEAAHRTLDRREYELTKRISLRAVDAGALVDLREDGACVFELPEVFFDLDHPGHYMRRIKSVSLTIPAVVGPHTSVGARLVLEQHRTRVDSIAAGGYAEEEDDPRFEYGFGGPQAIATSQSRDDAGLFQLNFADERYLPFEGSGVISRWRIQLPSQHRQFDYTTISDVQLQIAYTAREGGDTLRTQVEDALAEGINAASAQIEAAAQQPEGVTVMLHAAKDFPVDWERFLRPTGEPLTALSVPIVADRFPHVLRRPGLTATGVEVIAVPREGTSPVGNERTLSLSPLGGAPTQIVLTPGDVPRGSQSFEEPVNDTPWVLDVTELDVTDPDDLLDLVLLVRFSI